MAGIRLYRDKQAEEGYWEAAIAGAAYLSELMTQVGINRSGGLFIICFLALYVADIISLIGLYLAARHRQDALSLIAGAFIGFFANISVGASQIPVMGPGLLFI